MPASVEILTKTQLLLWMNVSSLVIFSGERPGTVALLALAEAASWAYASICANDSTALTDATAAAARPKNRRRESRCLWIDSQISSRQSGIFLGLGRIGEGLGVGDSL